MQFNSYLFILFFLPVCVAGYFLLNRMAVYGKTVSNLFLLGMSLWFYGYFNPWYLLLICGSIMVNYVFSRALLRLEGASKKWLLIIALAFNLGLIFWFKYYDFFLRSVNKAFSLSFPMKNILLPLGISFFTFQQVSYVVDSYNGQTKDYGFIEYALFVSFFPQLVAGPIVLHDELIPQIRDEEKRRWNADNLAAGIHLFALGLTKKLMIADIVVRALNWVLLNRESASSLDVFVAMLAYTFEIYFDFSGYSDMATGIAKMFNFDLPINFDSPYKSLSINEFWKRWHMTLTRFFRKYVYFPLGGSRGDKGDGSECHLKSKVTFRTVPFVTYRNILIVFTLSGLWHGANYSFVLWGVLHGLLSVFERIVRYDRLRIPKVLRWLLMFLAVNVLWLLFRVEDVGVWLGDLRHMLALTPGGVSRGLFESMPVPGALFLVRMFGVTDVYYVAGVLTFAAVMVAAFGFSLIPENNIRREFVPSAKNAVGTALLLLWCILSLSGIFTFIYFNF